MRCTDYLRYYDLDNRKRHVHEHDRGRIIRFMVQYETRIGDKWYEVIRYDGAHGFAHKDIYDKRGRKRRQVPLLIGFNEAVILADRDINENWERDRERFLRS